MDLQKADFVRSRCLLFVFLSLVLRSLCSCVTAQPAGPGVEPHVYMLFAAKEGSTTALQDQEKYFLKNVFWTKYSGLKDSVIFYDSGYDMKDDVIGPKEISWDEGFLEDGVDA